MTLVPNYHRQQALRRIVDEVEQELWAALEEAWATIEKLEDELEDCRITIAELESDL
jgi:hypothetical protein